jgi:acetyl esterase/lipase
MPADEFTPGSSKGQERKGPRGRLPFPPPQMDTSHILRRWLDLTYGDESPNQKLDLYLPDRSEGPFPLIVAIHGGGFMGGDKGEMQIAPMLAGLKHDYAVASINYRLSGEAIFPALIQDCKSAIRFLRSRAADYHLAPDKVAAWGGSAGGYLASMLGTSSKIFELDDPVGIDSGVSCAVQAVVDWCGPSESFLKMDEEFRWSGLGAPDHSGGESPESLLLGAKITEIPELVRKASPLTYISADVPPFFIQHGELDHIVPVEQSIELAAAINRVAGPGRATLAVMPGVDHHGDPAFETSENIQQVLKFLDQCFLRK